MSWNLAVGNVIIYVICNMDELLYYVNVRSRNHCLHMSGTTIQVHVSATKPPESCGRPPAL